MGQIGAHSPSGSLQSAWAGARRPWLLPLVPLYMAGLALKNWRFDRDLTHIRLLRAPVVSVGSLSAGGAGKTPFVAALAELLQENGFRVDVLSRGYGRVGTATLRVDCAGEAARFGDEPLLLARSLGCPVYVSGERYAAGQMAEADFDLRVGEQGKHVHLLDDGFGHRQLARAVDILLLTAEDVRDHLLPAGNLREPLSALRRTDVIVLRREEAEALRPLVDRICASGVSPHTVQVWTVERRFGFVDGAPTGSPLVFCSIARPQDFEASLRQQGMRPAAFVRFRDHHRYSNNDILQLAQRARGLRANGFVTTAKDEVKLSPAMREMLEGVGPLATAEVRVIFDDPAAALADVQAVLARSHPEEPCRVQHGS